MNKIERSIRLQKLKGIVAFTKLAGKYKCDIKIVGDSSIVDGKSIMGIVSLARQQPLKVIAEGQDAMDFATQLDQLEFK